MKNKEKRTKEHSILLNLNDRENDLLVKKQYEIQKHTGKRWSFSALLRKALSDLDPKAI